MLKERLTENIKTAMLAGDKPRVEVLRGMKAAILNEEVSKGVRDAGLPDEQIEQVLAREVKKRIEAAELYAKAGRQELADTENYQKGIIEEFLPQQLSDEELNEVVASVVAELGEGAHMGQVIGAVKSKVGQSADGARIAAVVKQKVG
jgi:uncharacterized protein YqeY